ncbi:PAS domain-containing protein [Shewanella intestini]|uniref:PAS domain-containing protein n=1 Tax=Shewanella intestini TaxID=2017544 RepID=A0ABS5I5W3_9GAMM|nr:MULTISPECIES: PAS domain-containing protein [Shewanella]MBR9729414.1 PAS domain-containing protein [Shewanella intestini]MRG37494.1 PAS domain-containing protein [Shewanella sp. XMDDZSB0408]
MFKRKKTNKSSKTLLISTQSISWSRKQILSLASELLLLNIAIAIITYLFISMGERSLQDDWAEQRYSELQTVGTLAGERTDFLKFRTITFARGELLRQYLENPTPDRKASLISRWDSLSRNIPELMGLALFSPEGKLKFASSDEIIDLSLPPSVLDPNRALGGNDIYSSPMAFTPINGSLEPYVYQLAWIENPDQSVKGYLVTYNSVIKILQSIKPAFFDQTSPLLLLDTKGYLYAGASQAKPLKGMPDALGSSLSLSYPELWQNMAKNNYGQYHSDDATFVFLKVEMSHQVESTREYYVMSYIRHDDIAKKFFKWKLVLIFVGLTIGLLASLLFIIRQLYHLEKRAKINSMSLAHGLFSSENSCMIINNRGRIVCANAAAYKHINLPSEEVIDRTLQRIFDINDDVYKQIEQVFENRTSWVGEHGLNNEDDQRVFHISISFEAKNTNHWIVAFYDMTVFTQSQQQANQYQMMSEAAVAIVLTDAEGQIVKTNKHFNQLMQYDETAATAETHIHPLLGQELHRQWENILTSIPLQGSWSAQLMPFSKAHFDQSLKLTITGHFTVDNELEYLIITLDESSAHPGVVKGQHVIGQSGNFVMRMSDFEEQFRGMSESTRTQSSLMVIDISPDGLFSHLGDIDQIEKRQKDIEITLLVDVPSTYKIVSWQLGKMLIFLPETTASDTHQYAMKCIDLLKDNELGEGINIGIAGYLEPQNFEQYLAKAEVALRRAKQSGDQSICQAYTRAITLER